MTVAFDHIAHNYDREFSWSPIGVIQRKMVWRFLGETLDGSHAAEILELNCGTGEDALWFANHHHRVLATDLSFEMIRVARNKAIENQMGEKITFGVMDLLKASEQVARKRYDLVFSNFGGFNCLDEFQFEGWLKEQLPALLKPGGKFVAVLMSKFCAWETLYFLLKFKSGKAFRRLSNGPVEGKLHPESSVLTWYYSPKWIKSHLPEVFTVTAVKPIGLFIPPSYLNRFFSRNMKCLPVLEKLEKVTRNISAAAFVSDHYLIEIQLNPL